MNAGIMAAKNKDAGNHILKIILLTVRENIPRERLEILKMEKFYDIEIE